MAGINSLNFGALGIQRAQEGQKRDGRPIIRANVPVGPVANLSGAADMPLPSAGDSATPSVNPKADQHPAHAGAKTPTSFEDTVGTLLDIKA